MTNLIINLAVGVFAMCALSVILNNNIKKSIYSWVVLIGIVLSALAMLIDQDFYSRSFAIFASCAAAIAVYVTKKIYARGEL